MIGELISRIREDRWMKRSKHKHRALNPHRKRRKKSKSQNTKAIMWCTKSTISTNNENIWHRLNRRTKKI